MQQDDRYDEGDDFLYVDEGWDEIPRDVIHVTVHPSVEAIKREAFYQCSQMTTMTLGEKLEESGECAFRECTLLREISIPHAVKAIKTGAFYQCTQLTAGILGEGLEEIGEWAFQKCMR